MRHNICQNGTGIPALSADISEAHIPGCLIIDQFCYQLIDRCPVDGSSSVYLKLSHLTREVNNITIIQVFPTKLTSVCI